MPNLELLAKKILSFDTKILCPQCKQANCKVYVDGLEICNECSYVYQTV